MSKKVIVECKDLWKIYNEGTRAEVRAIRGINLKVFEGDFTAIIGSSGSGKSTLLNLLGCLDTPTRGHVYIDGRDISKMTPTQLAIIRREKIGFVFQSFNIIPSLTALQNVELPMIFKGIDEKRRVKEAKAHLERVGLGERMNHKPSELSGGEKQRVAIARSLSNDPAMILADEPTGNLDSKTSQTIIKTLKDLNKEGKTIIVITHDPLVAKHAKKRLILKDGNIIDTK